MRFRIISVGVLFLNIALSPVFGLAETTPENARQIEAILAQEATSRKSIHSIRFSAVEDVDQAPIPEYPVKHTSVRRSIVQKGQWRASTNEVIHTLTNGSQTYTSRAVLNDSYFAYSINGSGPDIYEHSSIKTRSKNAVDARHSYDGMSLMDFGVGDGRITLQDAYALSPKANRWDVSEARDKDGHLFYVIKRFSHLVANASAPDSEWWVDPSKASMLTRIVKYAPDGRVGVELTVTIQQVGPGGAWLPVAVEERVYPAWQLQPGDGTPTIRRVFKYSDIQVNVPVPDEQFTLQFLHCPDGSVASTFAPDGKAETLLMIDDHILPLNVARRILDVRHILQQLLFRGDHGGPAHS